MSTECELEVEQLKRENSWTNTARFKPADLSPSPEGRNQMVPRCVCGTRRGRHIVHGRACRQDIVDVACIRSSQSGVQDFQGLLDS